MSKKKVTIKDIALYAQVSTATVSKIINNKDTNIRKETREKVLNIIEKYKYIPNRVASSLVTKKTKTIGLVIPDISNPFFPEIARGVEDQANSEGYSVIVCNTDNSVEKEEKYISMLMEKMVDGIIMTAAEKENENIDFYKRIDIPIVLVDRDINIDMVKGRVLVDNFKGAYNGVSYMIHKGYEKIVMLSGPKSKNTSYERVEAYKQALKDHNIEFECVVEGRYSLEWGKEGVKKLLEKNVEFDAIFCANDLIAIGAIKELKNLKKSIPKDVGILGFDGIYIGEIIDPKLSTIKQPNYMMGYKSAEVLIDIINKNTTNNKDIILDTELIIRNSL